VSRVLLCWLGDADLRGAGLELPARPRPKPNSTGGPVAKAVEAGAYDRIILLNNRGKEVEKPYLAWLRQHTKADVEVRKMSLADVTDHGEIYEAVSPICEAEAKAGSKLTYHLSPGTPAMASVWMLLAKTRFPGAMIRSSPERGVEPASVPFDISAELLSDLLRTPAAELQRQSLERAPTGAAFDQIIASSREMRDVIAMAERVAVWPVAVLIEGESGTGKELFARAIHHASPRKDKPMVAVNCGAIPRDLVEAELFGHEKGAFTGAGAARRGYFEQADGGTLFLDELGELPLDAQVKMLRALENNEVRRVGSSEVKKVDVRIIAATNRSLTDEIAAGTFREDLFYRLAVARLCLPPIRERKGDLTHLIEFALANVNRDGLHAVPGYQEKKLSAGAKNLLLNHDWPGNVRELMGTLRRAAIWTDGATIRKEDAARALLQTRGPQSDPILGRPLGGNLDLRAVLGDVARHYIERALEESGGVKAKAAKLLGIPSYQTLSNWMDKYGVGQ
jgi:transcriptional regulator with GAF, ATPase, and Fis domain